MAHGALELTVSLPGLPALTVGLSRLKTDLADWRPFWTDRFAPFFYRQILENFVLEGAATGDRWAPLSTAYAIWKASHFPGTGILVRSGAMKASLTSANAPNAIFRLAANGTGLEIGTSLPYAIAHQNPKLGSRLPQRPPLRVNDAFMRVVGKSLQQFVQDAWVKRRMEWRAFEEGNMFGMAGA
jgi:hypothetical protein